jgi:lysozyme
MQKLNGAGRTISRPGSRNEKLSINEKLRYCIAVGVAACSLFVVLISQGGTESDTENSWKALSLEPSRGALFKQYAALAAKRPLGRQSFAFPKNFQFPNDAIRNRDGTLRENSLFGIDISHHQGLNIPVELLRRQEVAFVYVKATQGTDFADKTFGHYWEALGALTDDAKIPRGAYHFLSSDPAQSGDAQADRFLAYVELHKGFKAGDLPPALDLEWDKECANCPDRWQTRHRLAIDIIGTAVAFLRKVQAATGSIPLIYTNVSFLNDVGIRSAAQRKALLDGYRVWIFDISPKDSDVEIADPGANLPYQLWQFSWGGRLSSGGNVDIDIDSYKGTRTDLATLFH